MNDEKGNDIREYGAVGDDNGYVDAKYANGSPDIFKTNAIGDEAIREDNRLKRGLHGRHMQMIAVGGAIGAGLFVGSGFALYQGGPGSLLVCFMIVGFMVLMVMQALGELATMYPVNGAFFTYIVRFVDPSWGFAIGMNYVVQWLTILPFELTAAGITTQYWEPNLNVGIWIASFLVAVAIIQIFGVRGYGEVEFVLAIIKILACVGFILFGIIDNCGGVPTDPRGYIGARYWHAPYGAFKNGFHGFCYVFTVASFAFAGTELAGLAAAESSNPEKEVPRAIKQVFWRITFFYIVNLFILGLIMPNNSPHLLGAVSSSDTKASPFTLAIKKARVPVLPSIFNAMITIAVLSVANSATYGSTRTLQALAMQGMAPKFFGHTDKKGRPVYTIILQLLFGLLGFVNEATSAGSVLFGWLLALSGVGVFFTWGSICWAHIRFRAGWKAHGHDVDELPFKAGYGVWGSWIGIALNIICLMAQFYVAVAPVGESQSAYNFFEAYLAAPCVIFFYLFWKVWSFFLVPAHFKVWAVRAKDMDIYTGMRPEQARISGPDVPDDVRKQAILDKKANTSKRTIGNRVMGVVRALF